jgi:hypothetical protein
MSAPNVAEIVQAIGLYNGKVALAAKKLGITVQERLSLAESHPEIQAAIDEPQARYRETVELQFERAVLAGEAWAVKKAAGRRKAPASKTGDDEKNTEHSSMTTKELTKEQIGLVLAWAAEGLRLPEINELAAKLDEPFAISYYQLRSQRKKLKTKFSKLRQEFEKEVVVEGLARKGVRIHRLSKLAEKLEEDLFEKERLWVTEPKAIGNDQVDVERFNAAEVKECRGLLDDIAREVGDRRTKIDMTTKVDVTKLSDDELRRIVEAESEGLARAPALGARTRNPARQPDHLP